MEPNVICMNCNWEGHNTELVNTDIDINGFCPECGSSEIEDLELVTENSDFR